MLAHPLAGPDSWVNYLSQLHLRSFVCVDGTVGLPLETGVHSIRADDQQIASGLGALLH